MEIETQDTHGTENVAGAENQKEPEGSKQPTLEEAVADNARKDAEIKRLHGLLKANQRQAISRDEFNSLVKKVDDSVSFNAQMLDEILTSTTTGGLGNDGYGEQRQPQRKTFTQQLEDKRKAEAAQSAPQTNPEAQAFVSYMQSHGLNWNSPEVQDAIGETDGTDRTPAQALEFLKTKVEEREKGLIQTEAEKIADKIWEKKVKDLGFAGTGAIAPNAGGGPDTSKMSARELIKQGLADAEKQKKE